MKDRRAKTMPRGLMAKTKLYQQLLDIGQALALELARLAHLVGLAPQDDEDHHSHHKKRGNNERLVNHGDSAFGEGGVALYKTPFLGTGTEVPSFGIVKGWGAFIPARFKRNPLPN